MVGLRQSLPLQELPVVPLQVPPFPAHSASGTPRLLNAGWAVGYAGTDPEAHPARHRKYFAAEGQTFRCPLSQRARPAHCRPPDRTPGPARRVRSRRPSPQRSLQSRTRERTAPQPLRSPFPQGKQTTAKLAKCRGGILHRKRKIQIKSGNVSNMETFPLSFMLFLPRPKAPASGRPAPPDRRRGRSRSRPDSTEPDGSGGCGSGSDRRRGRPPATCRPR